ncbi:3-oxoadipate enol-lactonase [Roseobacter sp.]|uniref:3-oxoadipate enol-lactonase n=1 Tax=Roseobacter sp. TaxID=1907202 RepID=UPI0025CCC052|nr:3-oxoadipate enol-lactonase [Roseobacter sp.]
MHIAKANSVWHHWREDGDPNGPPVVFANSLGTDLRLWDTLIPLLPQGYRFIRYDKRGHGLSECPEGPYQIDDLTKDVEALIETLNLGSVLFVGLSIGGMIGLNLAIRRPDLVRALVLSNSAVKMGTAEMWQTRISDIEVRGIEAQANAILERWFGTKFRASPETKLWRAMLTRTPIAGYIGCCAAIADADLSTLAVRLRHPVLGIAGAEDEASHPDLVAETCALIPGAVCHTIPAVGHLPCVEAPAEYAAVLSTFLEEHANA